MADPRFHSLAYAVRGRVVAKYTAQLGLVLAALSAVPFAVAVGTGDGGRAWRFAGVIAVLVLAGLLDRLPAPARVQTNEALAVTGLAFLLSPLLMAFPLMGPDLPFADALFEAVSAITTTGLTTAGTVEDRSAAFLFARAWMQWYGGLGIVILSAALLMGHTVTARRLVEPAYTGETIVTTIRTHARRVIAVYLLLTAVAVVALWAVVDDGFTALAHALTAVSTGGFSTRDGSLADLPAAAAPVVLGAALLGAISLPLYYRAWYGGWRRAAGDLELRALLVAVVVAGGATAGLAHLHGLDGVPALWHGALVGLSAQTGTGFTTLDPTLLGPATLVVLVAAMLIGGSIGSTTGGVKLLRVVVLCRLLQWSLQRSAAAVHAVVEPRLGGRPLENDDIIRVLLLFSLFGLVVLLSWLAFLVAGYPPLPALFEVASATGTVGLTAGITRPELEPLLKAVLCFDMLAGRLEVVALLVLLYPWTWFGRRGARQ